MKFVTCAHNVNTYNMKWYTKVAEIFKQIYQVFPLVRFVLLAL